MKKILLLIMVAFTTATITFAQEVATSKSGKKVMLHKDGTWTLIKEAPATDAKPANLLPGPAKTNTPSGAQSTSGSNNVQSAVPTSTNSSEYKRTTSVQCSGTTQKGARCKRMTLSVSGRCYQH